MNFENELKSLLELDFHLTYARNSILESENDKCLIKEVLNCLEKAKQLTHARVKVLTYVGINERNRQLSFDEDINEYNKAINEK